MLTTPIPESERVTYVTLNNTRIQIPVEDIRQILTPAVFDPAAEAAALAILQEDIIELTP